MSLAILAAGQVTADETTLNWNGKPFTSKWDRVKETAKSIFWGGVAPRLQAKDEVIDLLLLQEDNYPIVYVDVNAEGNENGSSWEDAFTDIQDAVDFLYDQGLEGWVWVAKGVYSSTKDPRSVVLLKKKVMLFGGFNGDETTLAQRDSVMHETIIQGWIGTEGYGQRGVSMEHLTLIDGFTIRNSGFTRGVEWQFFGDKISGGGIRTRSWLAIIRNNIIYETHAKGGSAIAVYALNEGNSYIYNTHNVPGYDPIIEHNIMYNTHSVCGAVQLRNSETLYYQNVLYDNFQIVEAGSEDRSKGVEMIMHTALHDPPIIINSILWKNTGYSSWTPDLYNNAARSDPPDAAASSYYNCIQKRGYGTGLIEADPQFVDPENHNFMLKPTSPCIDAGYPDSPPDPDGSRADIGIPVTRFQVLVDKGEAGGITNDGSWYYPGSFVDISVEEEIVDQDGTSKYTFAGWVGEGEGSYTGPMREIRIQANSNITQRVVWQKERKLQVISETDQDAKSGWYADGDTVALIVPSYIEIEKETRRVFIEWNGVGQGSYSGTDTVAVVVMTSPVVQQVSWQNTFFVTLASSRGTVKGDGWYDEGATATCYVESTTVAGSQGTRYKFARWEGAGQGAYSGTSSEFTIPVYNPVSETAVWDTQYHLTVESQRGTAEGTGWYYADSTVVISVDTVEAIDTLRRYHFWKWQGSGQGSYSGTDVSHQVVMKGPVTQNAIWRKEFFNTIHIEPRGYGSVSPISEQGDWWPEAEEIQLLAVGNADSGYGFVRWSGDMESSDNPLVFSVDTAFTLSAHFEQGDVRIETEPPGLDFTADGQTYKAPRVFYWLPGQEHTLAGIEFQAVSDDTQYVFKAWQHGGSREQVVSIPGGPVTYTAQYDEKYAVRVESAYNKATVTGTGWYFKGTSVTVAIDSTTDPGSSGERFRFNRWTGYGDGSVSSENAEVTVTVNGPVTQEARWSKQFQLDAAASPSYSGIITVTPEGPWFDSTATAYVHAAPVDTNFTFTGWSGYYEGVNNPVIVDMYQPVELTAHFSTTSVFPPTISALPSVSVLEDDTIRYSYFDMYNYVQDLNDSMDRLKFSTPRSHFTAVNDTVSLEILLIPDPDWNGTEDVTLKVTDPYALSDSTVVTVKVIPVADYPARFTLASPEDKYTVTGINEAIEFVWHASRNVDTGDSLEYIFYLGEDSTFTTSNLSVSTSDTSLFVNKSYITGINYWMVKARDQDGYVRWADRFREISYFSSVEPEEVFPEGFVIGMNYPNPFNSSTCVDFTLPRPGRVRVMIRDARGRQVARLADKLMQAGAHTLSWEGTDNSRADVPSGLYFFEIRYDALCVVRKLLLVR